MSTNIKITALTDIGNNIAPTTLVPVVDMAGPSTTKKANLQNVGNLILNGAGGSNFVPAARAILSQSVTNAAQPNITSTGTLTSLTVSGNVNLGSVNNLTITGGTSGQVLSTDGNGALSWVNDASSSYSNNNVANYLPTFTGTVGANRISSNTSSGSNLEINANGAVFTFGQGGALFFPATPGNTWAIEPNIDNEFEIKSTSNVVISTDISNANSHFTFDSEGIFTAPSNVNLLGTRLNIGSDSIAAELVNPTIVISTTGSEYIQAAIINSSSNGSSDWAAYGADADDFQAFADLGFAGHTFNDANFSITNPGDAYVLGQGYANGIGGALVLATGENGNVPDIVFATGGFTSNTEFARIDHANNVFHLTRANSGIQFADGSIQTTAGGGGSTGNVTFDDVTVQGDNSELNLSAGPDYTANLAYLQVRAGDVASHIHFDTGNSEAYDLIIGNDQKFVQVSSTGNIIMSSYDSANALTYTMTLDTTGNLILAGGNSVIQSVANSSLDPLNPNVSTMILTPSVGYSSQSLVLDPTAPGHIHLRAPGANIDEPLANIFLGGEESSFEIGYHNGNAPNAFIHSGGNTWTFDNGGNLVFPRDAAGNTDPILTITGGANPKILSEDVSLAGPANLEIAALNTIFTGSSGSAIKIYADDGEIGSTANLQIWTNSGGNTEYSWTFGNDGVLTLPQGSQISETANTSVNITANTNTWAFGVDGNLTLPGDLVAISASPAPVIRGFSSVSALQFTNGNSNVTVNANSNLWTFDSTGNLIISGSSGGFIKTVSNASIGIAAVDNGTNNPAQLLSLNAGTGAATSIISAYATNATIQTNATGAINTWAFDSAGNLTLPGNAVAIKFANGSAAFGNIATINLNGNTSQVLLGNGAFAAIPSSSIIANGNSNVSIATANGNVVINAVGNTTMTVTGTGANVTGTLTSTGKIGYASGSTVTQTTNRGNGVTINALAGTIITTSAAMVANQIDTFSVANDQVDPNNDIVLVQIVSPNFGVYNCIAQPSSTISVSLDGFYVNIVNISGFTTSDETITIRFMVIKAPNA